MESQVSRGHRFAVGRHPAWSGRIGVLVCLVLLIGVVGGCTRTVTTHGHLLEQEALDQIEPGQTSQLEVARILGSPSAMASFGDKDWYYVSQRTERLSFYQEDVVEQEVVAVRFDDQGVVEKIERHGIEEASAITPVDRKTPTAGRAPTVMEQLIGNIGRFGDGAPTSTPGAANPAIP